MELIRFNFNQIGIIHNKALQEIVKLPDFPNFSLEEVYYVGVKTQNELFMSYCDEIPTIEFSKIEPFYKEIENSADFTFIIDKLHKEKLISAALKKELDIFAKNISNSTNYKELAESVNDFVNSFNSNEKLTEDEKVICWSTASVAFFSLKYWNHAAYNPSSAWFKLLTGSTVKTKTAKGKWWHVVLAVGADCAGVVIGAGVGGAVAGPAGAAAGAGAVGAGASAAVTKALNPSPPPAS